MMTKLRSGQGKRDDADADAATFMSPFQPPTKVIPICRLFRRHKNLFQVHIVLTAHVIHRLLYVKAPYKLY